MELKNTDMPERGWWNYLPNKSHKWIRLVRIDRPIGTWLLLLPCLWTLPLSKLDFYSVTKLMLIFTLGAFLMRSSGCIINDLWDREIDKNISRTKYRPIASGEISPISALYLLIFLLILAFLCLINLNKNTWVIACFSIPLIIFYPLAKRITKWPQVVLGFAFSWGVPTAWAATGENFSFGILSIYFATIFWVIGYDTIYGCQDKLEDKVYGIYNSSISAEKYLKQFIISCYLCSIILFILGGLSLNVHYGWYLGVFFMTMNFLFQIRRLDDLNKKLLLKLFQSNKIAGIFLTIGSISKYLYF